MNIAALLCLLAGVFLGFWLGYLGGRISGLSEARDLITAQTHAHKRPASDSDAARGVYIDQQQAAKRK